PPIPHPERPPGRTTWHRSGEFMKYDRGGRDPNLDAAYAEMVRKHYAACVSYADAQVGRLTEKLRELTVGERTVVVVWGDHGWHLGEHAVWGKHTLFEESLRSPLIIAGPGTSRSGCVVETVVETLDVFPTLCEMTGISIPDFTNGASLCAVMEDPQAKDHPAISYQSSAKAIRTSTHRMILHNDGFVELYDHTAPEAETENLTGRAMAPGDAALIAELTDLLHRRLANRK
ncbi:MAG: sulfatase-like hydrolase/transferase, partial [Planctomycetota bacterium]